MSSSNRGATSVRLLTAAVLLPLTLALIWVPVLDWGFAIFVVVLAAVGAKEFCDMAGAKGFAPHTAYLITGCALINGAAWWGDVWVDAVFVAALCVITFRQLVRSFQTITGISTAFFGLLYMGWLPAHFILLHRGGYTGASLVTMLILIVALADSGAYFAGRAFGKHKMAPKVSPNKTWEGVAGGVAASLAGMALMLWMSAHLTWFEVPGHPIWFYMVLTLLVVAASILGDLLESMLKRDARVKDSGTIFPGHGGVLDRCDGMLLAGPVMYYCLAAFNG